MSARAPCVLVVDDEPAQREALAYNLMSGGFRVVEAADGEEALGLVAKAAPDIVLLDWMLPNASGIEVCRRLRASARTRDIPILMISARTEDVDRVRGLDSGADDYVVKPYSMRELMARVRTQLRRSRSLQAAARLEHEDIVLDPETHRVTRGGREVKLGPTEYRLLAVLMQSSGRVWSRSQLLDRAWGEGIHVDLRTVDVHIGRLRKALRCAGGGDPVRTVRGAGYALG